MSEFTDLRSVEDYVAEHRGDEPPDFEWLGALIDTTHEMQERLDVAISDALETVSVQRMGQFAMSEADSGVERPEGMRKNDIYSYRKSLLIVRSAVGLLSNDTVPELVVDLGRTIEPAKERGKKKHWRAVAEATDEINDEQFAQMLSGFKASSPIEMVAAIEKYTGRLKKVADGTRMTEPELHSARRALRKFAHLAQIETLLSDGDENALWTYASLWQISSDLSKETKAMTNAAKGERRRVHTDLRDRVQQAVDNIRPAFS